MRRKWRRRYRGEKPPRGSVSSAGGPPRPAQTHTHTEKQHACKHKFKHFPKYDVHSVTHWNKSAWYTNKELTCSKKWCRCPRTHADAHSSRVFFIFFLSYCCELMRWDGRWNLDDCVFDIQQPLTETLLWHYAGSFSATWSIGRGGRGGRGWGSQENKKNGEWKNYREDIFVAVSLRKHGGWEKQFPTISKLIKRLQFISV